MTLSESDTILIMLSGGIDSAYLLHYYLHDTQLPVHAHHISIRYPTQQRWKAEDPACDRIVAWCRENLRDFEYSTSRFDLGFSVVGWDSDLQLLVASKVALNFGSNRITLALGWCMDDLARPEVLDRHERNVTSGLWAALCKSVSDSAHINPKIATPLVDRGLTKADVISRLPRDLLASTWSCRTPVFEGLSIRACGTCHACILRLSATLDLLTTR